MVRKIAIANQKGGTGKTTTAINLSAALTEKGRHILMVDMDPQFNCTTGIGINLSENQNCKTVYDLLLYPETKISEATTATCIQGLDVVPSCLELAGVELQLQQIVGREKILQGKLDSAKVYDYVIMDCPPSLGLLTLNALTAATHVLIPIQVGKWALTGANQLFDTITLVKGRLNRDLQVIGILCTMYDSRTILGREVLEHLRERFGDKLFKTIVKRTVKIGEAEIADSPVTVYAKHSEVAQSYRDLAREIEER